MLYELTHSNRKFQIKLESQTNLTFGMHMHSSFEVVLVTAGELICTISGETYRVGQGQAILIPPNRLHAFLTEDFSQDQLLIFSTDFVGSFYRAIKDATFADPVFPCDAAILREFDWSEHFFLQKALLYRICGIAYQHCEPIPLQGRNELLIQNIALYVQDNYAEDLTLEKLSKALGYHPCYLSSFINQNFGMNFRSLVNRYRVSAAEELLQDTDSTIAEIALLSGFSTIRSFNRAFEQIRGICPRDFRRGVHATDAEG